MRRSGGLHMAALLGGIALFLGAAAPAFALTVFCVPTIAIDPACITGVASGTPNAIQAAINQAQSGDIIIVGPGLYSGNSTTSPVEIPSGLSISLYGAQAGNPPSAGKRNGKSSSEAIIDATNAGGDGSGIVVRATNVRIDGFTVEGATSGNASGIDLKGGGSGGGPASGAVVVNNILQDNSTGISVNSEGFTGPVQNVLIENNLIVDNNSGTSGNGDGLFTGGMQEALIIGNTFKSNETSDIGINSPNGPPNNTHDVTIVANTSSGSATFAIFTGTTNATVGANSAVQLGEGSSLPGAGNAAVSIGPGNANLAIIGNFFAHGRGNVSYGVAFTTLFGGGSSTGNIVSGNEIDDMPQAQIFADAATLINSRIEQNELTGGNEGISLGTGDSGNFVTQNTVQDAHQFGCSDASTGSGTLDTANTWFRNTALGESSSPSGLCTSSKGKGK